MIEYRLGDGIIIGVDSDKDLPYIGEILKLYVINNNDIYFEVRPFHSKYDPHYRVYTLDQSSADTLYVHHLELFMQIPVHIRALVSFDNGHRKLFILPHAL